MASARHSLGSYLKGLRLKSGLSLREAATELNGPTYQFVYNMEHNKSLPPMGMIKKLAKMYAIADKAIRIEIVRELHNRLKKKYGINV